MTYFYSEMDCNFLIHFYLIYFDLTFYYSPPDTIMLCGGSSSLWHHLTCLWWWLPHCGWLFVSCSCHCDGREKCRIRGKSSSLYSSGTGAWCVHHLASHFQCSVLRICVSSFPCLSIFPVLALLLPVLLSMSWTWLSLIPVLLLSNRCWDSSR